MDEFNHLIYILTIHGVENLASVLAPVIGLGWDSVQESSNHGRASNKNWSPGMEFTHISFWKQGPQHTSTRSSGSN
jgi:hypothetical protein